MRIKNLHLENLFLLQLEKNSHLVAAVERSQATQLLSEGDLWRTLSPVRASCSSGFLQPASGKSMDKF